MYAYACPAAVLILSLSLTAPAFGATPAPACGKHCKPTAKRPLGAPLPPRTIVTDPASPAPALPRDVATLKAARLALAR